MFGKINKYLVLKADFNCKLMFCKRNFILPNIYFTKLYSTFTFELTHIHETAALCKFVIQQILWAIRRNPSQIMKETYTTYTNILFPCESVTCSYIAKEHDLQVSAIDTALQDVRTFTVNKGSLTKVRIY